MNCANHPDAPAVAYCRTCGKPLCSTCARDVGGAIQCDQCLASQSPGSMPPPGATAIPPVAAPRPDAPRPALAAILGCIPGVGAMYNGEFAKGFIHVLIFATLIWMTDHISGLFGLAIAAFVIYMPIEAYKTARARELGLAPPDPFGMNNWLASTASGHRATGAANVAPVAGDPAVMPPGERIADESCSRVPVGAIILIGLGVLFLLDEMGALHFDWIWRFWPLILIALGVRILVQRQRRGW
jgi:TM2 domain-containing membrane protein YozV